MKKPIKTTKPIDFPGWVLISKEGDGKWHIAWLDVFYRKKDAVEFAIEAEWSHPFKAVRGRITVDHQ